MCGDHKAASAYLLRHFDENGWPTTTSEPSLVFAEAITKAWLEEVERLQRTSEARHRRRDAS